MGFVSQDPVVLQRTNNVVVWLRPHEIIAKVGKSTESEADLIREHDVAAALAARGGPVGPPLPGIEPTRDVDTGLIVTLWKRLQFHPDLDIDPMEVGSSLQQLHESLRYYRSELPGFREKLSKTRAVLADDQRMTALLETDRSMLRTAFDQLGTELDAYRGYTEQPLHGEPHSANLLATAAGLRWIDLEGACTGPLEWDLAFLPDEAIAVFPAVNSELLGLLRILNSARVATWCWAGWEFEEMRWHAEHHLAQVRVAVSDSR
jgi:Phosphotransferase enzyme family